jgi:hypothetical protein
MKAIMRRWRQGAIRNQFESSAVGLQILERMAEWLKACGVEMVVMQSTDVYWMALNDILGARKFKVRLTNAPQLLDTHCSSTYFSLTLGQKEVSERMWRIWSAWLQPVPSTEPGWSLRLS